MPTVLSADFPLHFRTDGDDRRPALLLINPLGTTLEVWDPFLEEFCRHNWVIRFDLRGHGRSVGEVEPFELSDLGGDVVAILDALEVPRAHLFGASLGGLVALWLAAHEPDRVDRLVLASTAPMLGPDHWWERTVAEVSESGLRSVADHVETVLFSAEWLKAMPDAAERARQMFLQTPDDAYLAGANAILHCDLRDDARTVRASTLLIAGELDPVLAHFPVSDLLDAIPDAEEVQVAGAAHRVIVEQPALIAPVICDFLTDPDGH